MLLDVVVAGGGTTAPTAGAVLYDSQTAPPDGYHGASAAV